ncbi:MAG: pantetheine-phosphate adenylyltransferase [Planctomycetota bacterium]|jgi:cytidyltransferase-like protein
MAPAPTHHLALYTGSFDPITLGHLDVLRRARGLFDKIILAIGDNPEKPALFTFDERLEMARALVQAMVTNEPNGSEVEVEHYSGLTVDYAKRVHAAAILRGISASWPSRTGRSPGSRPCSSSRARTSPTPAPASSSRSPPSGGRSIDSPASFHPS